MAAEVTLREFLAGCALTGLCVDWSYHDGKPGYLAQLARTYGEAALQELQHPTPLVLKDVAPPEDKEGE